jgi:hypothetical protein
MSLFAEIWTRPGAAIFERVVVGDDLGPASFTKRGPSAVGEGRVILPANWDRIAEVIVRDPATPANDVRRLVRAFDSAGPTYADGSPRPVYEWFLDVTSDEFSEGFVDISGPGIESVMADAIVYPWDWAGGVNEQSLWPNWIYGGKDLIGDIESRYIPEVVRIWTTATGGTFTLEISADGGAFETTDAIAYNATVTVVETEIEENANVTDVTVTGGGTASNPWIIQAISPEVDYVYAINSGSLTGGTGFIQHDQSGRLIPVGWEESHTYFGNILHGVNSEFRLSTGTGTDPALPACDTSGFSIMFNGTEPWYPGIQKVVSVQPGGIYQAEVWVYAQTTGTQFRFVVRDLGEQLIAFQELTLIANTWTQFSIPNVMIPASVERVVFRVGHIGTGDPPRTFVACSHLYEGLPATTAGAIMRDLLDDATIDHVADGREVWDDLAGGNFMDYSTFTDSLDSNAVAWDDSELSFTIPRGKNYLQVLGDLAKLGYEWEVVPHPSTPGRWRLNLYNPDGLGSDLTASDTAINVGQGTTAGPIFRSHLVANTITVEGAAQFFSRSQSSASISTIGRREWYVPDRGLTDLSSTAIRAAEEVAGRLLSGLSVNLNIEPIDDGPRPLVDYDVGDTLNVQVPPLVTRSAHQLSVLTANLGPDGETYALAFSSESFTGSAGVTEAVRRLMLKFEGIDQEAPRELEVVAPGTGGGSEMTVTVAASDASEYSRSKADFVCDGIDDQIELQAAIDLIDTLAWSSGTVVLSEGTFKASAASSAVDALTVKPGVGMRGQGLDDSSTGTYVTDNGVACRALIGLEGQNLIQGLSLETFAAAAVATLRVTGAGSIVRNCFVYADATPIMLVNTSLRRVEACTIQNGSAFAADGIGPSAGATVAFVEWIVDNEFIECAGDAIHFTSPVGAHIIGNYFETTGHSAIYFDADGATVQSNQIVGNHISSTGNDGSATRAAIHIQADTAGESFIDLLIASNVIFGAIVEAGISIQGVNHCLIVGNTIEDASLKGIVIRPYAADATRSMLTIAANIVSADDRPLHYITAAGIEYEDVSVVGNTFNGQGPANSDRIRFEDGADRLNFSYNTVVGCGVEFNTLLKPVVIGNVLRSTESATPGVLVQLNFDTCLKPVIVGNVFNVARTAAGEAAILITNNTDDAFCEANAYQVPAAGTALDFLISIATGDCNNTHYVGNFALGTIGAGGGYNDAGTGSINTFAGGAGLGDNL